MAITRKFLDWHRAALPAAVEFLTDRYATPAALDLAHCIVVLPGGHAGRRLIELLLQAAEDRQLVLQPPDVCTPGNLPERLYAPRRPFASDLVQQLAWVQTLHQMGPARYAQLLAKPPADDDFISWLEVGSLLARQHRELAADGLDFGDVVKLGQSVPGFSESARWQLLADIQSCYHNLLDELELWDLQTARRVAIAHHECRSDHQIILLGTTDMPVSLRQMLDQVADKVTALVHAPPDLADHFDEHGCLVPAKWTEQRLNIQDSQIRIADGPHGQAALVADTLRSYNGAYRADQVTVGIPDETIIPAVQQALGEAGLTTRWVVGRTVSETGPFRLLDVVGRLIGAMRYRDFAELVRHPDMSRWLDRQMADRTWLLALDRSYNDHLPTSIRDWPTGGNASDAAGKVRQLVVKWLEPLQDTPRSLADWSPIIADVLLTIFGDAEFDTNEPTDYYALQGLQAIRQALLAPLEVPATLLHDVPAAAALEQLRGAIGGTPISAPPDAGAIQLLGWLELPMDTAPAVVVTSFNEGRVPSSVNSDLFLPNTLRRQLGLVDNDRRYARDAYATSVLLASRDNATLIVGRRSLDNDPVAPSRLLFATDDQTLVQRVRQFFDPDESVSAPRRHGSSRVGSESCFVVPCPHVLTEPIKSIRVTAFRTYLACPYRYYLRHVLRLESINDTAEELDGAAFGNMLHAVLSDFGNDPMRASIDDRDIVTFLHDRLNVYATNHFGKAHAAALDVQMEQARARLAAFARWQAAHARDGWEIVYAETAGGADPATLAVADGRTVNLAGRIDRIDRRGDDWTVLDYKTADEAKKPQQIHMRNGAWVDLQLPLYRHIVATLDIVASIQLGYIVLPKDVTKTGLLVADWDAETLAGADATAAAVAKNILDGCFWPPTVPPPRFFEEYAALCQDTLLHPRFTDGAPSTSEARS